MNRFLGALLCFFTGLHLAAADSDTNSLFRKTASVGLSLTSGNSETLLANASLLTEADALSFGSLRAGVEGRYGESRVAEKTDKTVETASALLNVKNTLTSRTFGALNVSALYDAIADIDYRATIAPLWGGFLLQSDGVELTMEIGPAYVWERIAGVDNDYMAYRVAERFARVWGERSRIWQSAEYLPKADDFGDYLLNSEVGAEAALNGHLSLRIVLQSKYDSTPGAGLKCHDLSLIAGVSSKF